MKIAKQAANIIFLIKEIRQPQQFGNKKIDVQTHKWSINLRVIFQLKVTWAQWKQWLKLSWFLIMKVNYIMMVNNKKRTRIILRCVHLSPQIVLNSMMLRASWPSSAKTRMTISMFILPIAPNLLRWYIS